MDECGPPAHQLGRHFVDPGTRVDGSHSLRVSPQLLSYPPAGTVLDQGSGTYHCAPSRHTLESV